MLLIGFINADGQTNGTKNFATTNLVITGDTFVCLHNDTAIYTYSVPHVDTVTYSWNVPAAYILPPVDSSTISVIWYYGGSCGTNTIRVVEQSAGGYIDTGYLNVHVSPKPYANFSSSYLDPIYTKDILYFRDESSGNAFLPVRNWLWSFGDGSTSHFQFPTYFWNTSGNMDVTLTVGNDCGCTDTAHEMITVLENVFVLPNIFTPNKDGYNDEFEVRNSGMSAFTLTIYNRFGAIIFETTGKEIAWDGTNTAGMLMDDGTYFYTVKATSETGKNFNKSGFITLLR